MSFTIPYGKSTVTFDLPNSQTADIIAPQSIPGADHPLEMVKDALDHPVGDLRIGQLQPIRTAAIAINDKTRPVPHELLLPPLLKWLEKMGVAPSNTKLLVASGTHTPMMKDEYPQILPQSIVRNYPISSHDCEDAANLVNLGVTSRGTPVQINRQFMEADLRIVLGDIEPHHFMGFSGGVKSAAIGLASRETITRNHSMLPDPMSRTAEYERNPMRQDLEEIGDLIGVHLACNAILNTKKEIVRVIAGQPRAVMQAGIPLSRSICQVEVGHRYDLVIASAGGHPKDINFYQAQKALTHAAMLTRSGGVVILAVACPEGVGSEGYARWMEGVSSQAEAMQRFQREGFQVGPHKAFLVARDATRIRVILVSDMEGATVERLLLEHSPSISDAVAKVQSFHPGDLEIAILPNAVATIPLVRE